MKTIALCWAPFGHRLDELSGAVGGRRVSITLFYGPRYFAPLRYLALFMRTLVLLFTQRPDIVFAQNPPVFCPFTSLIYCRAAGKVLVVDHHSVWRVKTVGGAVGRAIGFLEAFVASSARLNTAPHGVWASELEKMGARKALVVHDFVERNPYSRDEATRRRYAETPVVAIASHGGHPLERIETEVASASESSGTTLLITGPPSKLAARLKDLPPNVKYLGMLPMEEYLRLKASVDFAVNITDEPYTLSHVIFEYVASSLPVISSRQRVVEDVFADSLLYVGSSQRADVSDSVKKLGSDLGLRKDYARRASLEQDELQRVHAAEIAELREYFR